MFLYICNESKHLFFSTPYVHVQLNFIDDDLFRISFQSNSNKYSPFLKDALNLPGRSYIDEWVPII